MLAGQLIGGEFGKLVMRQKTGRASALGELVACQQGDDLIILQVYDLLYGSQISSQNLELIAGMQLEDGVPADFMDPQLRNYQLALLKNLVTVTKHSAVVSKQLPAFFSSVREVQSEDFSFLQTPSHPLQLGFLRSGARSLNVPAQLPGKKVFSHHVLLAGTTGRGKSNCMSTVLWDATSQEYCGMLVLDPHDEYYGRDRPGLKDHPSASVTYYTAKQAPPGARSLKINLELIRPHHLQGVVDFSDAQQQAMQLYAKEYGNEWIESIILEKPLQISGAFRDETLAVVRRRLLHVLDLEFVNNHLHCSGIFDLQAGQTTVADITQDLQQAKTVIIDTSTFTGAAEVLIGSLVAHAIFFSYKREKMNGTLNQKPVVSIVLEEAPRVLGKDALERGPNIFSTIAREGRKFQVGLFAITQLPSLIPRDILANMNTKIILGIEMKPERMAIIESASQDLSDHDRAISSLDVGEALVSTNFSSFVLPLSIPLFSVPQKQSSTVSMSELKP